MSFSGRLRLSLLLVALVPPIAAVAVMYVYTSHQARQAEIRRADRSLQTFRPFQSSRQAQLRAALQTAADDPSIRRAVLQLTADESLVTSIQSISSILDFLEIIDRTGRVRASAGRPGLIDRQVSVPNNRTDVFPTVEYDLSGAHAADAACLELSDRLLLYGGVFFDEADRRMLEGIIDGSVSIIFARSRDDTFARMTPLTLYDRGDSIEAVLSGSADGGYYVVAGFPPSAVEPQAGSLVTVIGLVLLCSVAGALAVGWYLTGRATREIRNLIEASERVAAGDFSTPVMAYEEGEFARLADSFTDMMFRLRRAREDLATAEKIAAWEAVGRKIAHEVKNPLTPIAIAVDDLRLSYEDRLPDFGRTLAETTQTIKSELGRLMKLLDGFVAFARMPAPVFATVPVDHLLQPLTTLYRHEIADRRLTCTTTTPDDPVTVDPDQIRQLLVNAIKNALETGPHVSVAVTAEATPDELLFTVRDTGPGFPEAILAGRAEPGVSMKSGGFGLGLVICQRIVYDHGGLMQLANDSSGAVITISLPRTHGPHSGH